METLYAYFTGFLFIIVTAEVLTVAVDLQPFEIVEICVPNWNVLSSSVSF